MDTLHAGPEMAVTDTAHLDAFIAAAKNAGRPACVLAKTGYVLYDTRPEASAVSTFQSPLSPADVWTLHQWVARTDIPVDAEEAAEIHRNGWWSSEPTHNRDGLTRVQARVVCSACGEKFSTTGGSNGTS